MHQAIDRILYGLCFGIGFWIASNVLALLGTLIHAPH